MPTVRERARAFLRAASDDGTAIPVAHRRAVLAIGFAASLVFWVLSTLRWTSYHDTTFDLAFYARMCWGEANGSNWNPILDAHAFGLHLVWIFEVLGWVGVLLGTVPTLLVTQALAVGLAVVPLSRIGARHLGPSGAIVAALAFVLHPNVGAVAAGEFHPGTVAVLPLAWLADALDRQNARAVLLASLGVLACREDLGLVATIAALVVARAAHRASDVAARQVALGTAAVCAAYVAFFLFVLHPMYAPAQGSLALHFGGYAHEDGAEVDAASGSVGSVLVAMLGQPGALLAHLLTGERLAYLFVISAPLALLPLRSPSSLLVASPVLGVALLSRFPTTLCLDSHYLTPALPLLVRGAVVGAARLPDRPWLRTAPIVAAALAAHGVAGGTPLSLRFDPHAYEDDARSIAMRAIAAEVPTTASIQAPDAMLAHLAERRTLHRSPPPETRSDFVVLDLSHRRRFRHREDLLRTDEEPIARNWLARDDHAIVAAAGDFVLLERGLSPREGVEISTAIVGHADPSEGRRLAACLGLRDATLEEGVLVLVLVARGACPPDLALRVGTGVRPQRVDLIAGGLLSPAHFTAGDLIRSEHPLSPIEREAIAREGLRVGAIRQSGARPEHEDPLSIDVPL
jgi:uncharacterized membrane protein